ncbi:DUF4192 family protein [Streptomyces sp. SID8361]|uniref:DUF4192 family protein n=1 Tax=Streptomyces sp. MnatMP-M27 TaxID=1839768 RepID=UPI00081EACCF|nr:DUF4192 family protein [Streptomyces sp. MnatMP-M27]MYU11543.1 DUF4192 family protein [Streptomyces sp. SID8361]SCF82465.1 protein of unknown function [Streptomyces sp. MnatMP-M27]
MSTPNNTVQITSLPDLAQILPYLLGHYPDDSIALHAPGPNFLDGPTMTCPLPEDTAEWRATAENAARQFVGYAHDCGHDPAQGVVIYLCREPRPGQSPDETAALLAPIGTWLTNEFTWHRATVLRTIGLVANRWWDYECDIDGCCEGEPLPSPDDPTSVAAQMARLGRTPGPRTRDIVKEFRATADPDFLKDLHAAADHVNTRCATNAGRDAMLALTLDQIDAAMSQFHDGATVLSRALTTLLIVGLQDDAAVEAGMAHADDDDLPHARRLWAYLARHCAAPFTQEAVPILTLFAFVAWRQGDLIAARLALRDAIITDPDYELATAIHLGTIDGEDPQEWLASVRERHAHRAALLQHAAEVASEYRPTTDTTAVRYREALDTATSHHYDHVPTAEERLLARHGTIDIIDGAVTDFRNGRPQLMDEIAAHIILGLQDRETRDAALSTGEESNLLYERQLWGYLARRCVPPHTDKAPPLLTLLGWVAWRQDDTLTAAHAFADALDVNPGYELAKILLHGIHIECDPAALLAAFRDAAAQFAASRADLDTL